MQAILAVDLGTTSMRAILYDAGARMVHLEQREQPPRHLRGGWVEQDPAVWQAGLPELLRGCAEAARAAGLEPACIAVTAQRSSVIPVDAVGVPLHPAIMWQDRRTAGLARSLAGADPLVYRKSGLRISPVFSAVKMTWLRRERPDLWSRTHKLAGVQDWALYLLTGRWVTDHSFGSRTNLMNLSSRAWDPDLLDLFEVDPHLLCELVAPGAVVGGLTPAMATATGLTAGLPVVSAGGDQQCAALGLGLFSGERAVSNTGTGSYLIGHADRPVFDPGMRLGCNVSAVPGACIVEAAVLTSGGIYRWFKESLVAPGTSFEALEAQAAAVPPGANGLLLLPHFKGSGAPHWDPEAKGLVFNLTLGSTLGELARAILEGIAVELKESLELVEQLCGPAAAVSVAGGLNRSRLFTQIQSDVWDRPVIRFGDHEATALGAWIAGAVATGLASSYPAAHARAAGAGPAWTCRPDPANHEGYELQRRRACALYRALAAPELRELFR